ncbi:hypothetical protein CDL12_24999 [Handroanthus impetiginosus]|uniref:Uncharacterized protein n=1 Tax=Handroanthus impetiginosus TaxID=429701 RepID=A0A2G9GBA9_9LAMI|nr:hypothetical protein CDL12_24999 [Handroanthus impetiginosus]
MPGNELGDRVHNFFAQDNLLQGQNHSQVAEGNWPVLNNNFWVGGQRQADLLNSNNRNYDSQNPDRGEASYPLLVTHGLNFSQSNLRPDFAKSQSLNEQPQSNGFMYGNQFHQTRQNEGSFLAVDTDSNKGHSITSRGISVRESQAETFVSPVGFDLFGGQQRMSHQQSSIPQSLQHQQSGINDRQQLQQQFMIRKMQELQRQQQLQQFDLRQQNFTNQVPSFVKQTSGSQSILVNGTPNSDTLQYPWTADIGTRWLNGGSPTMQGSPSGLGFPPNHAQAQCLVDLVPQQVDQSVYGVPISSSRGLPVNQYSQTMIDRSSMPQMSTSSNFLQSSQHNFLPDQASAPDEPSLSRHKFWNENLFGLTSRQPLNTEMRNMGGVQQGSTMARNAPQQDFLGRQELTLQPETSREKPTRQVTSPQTEVALDPTEEKILFGSDDNIWATFGKVPNMSGAAGNSFDNVGLSNGLSSIQSGSWSALMQSAEDWSSLMFHIHVGPSRSQPPSVHNDSCRQETSLANDNMQMPAAMSSGSFPPSNDINTNYVMGFNQLKQKFQNDPGQRLQTEMPQRFFQSLEETGYCQMYRNASQNALQTKRNARTNSPPWVRGQIGTRLQSNGWNVQAAISPGEYRVMSTHEAEKSQQNSQKSKVRMMQRELVLGNSLWKSNPIPSSAIELGHIKSRVSNLQANQGILSLNGPHSVANSCNVGINDGTSPFVHDNYLLNQWKDAHPASSQGNESVGKPLNQVNSSNQVSDSMNSCGKDEVARHEMENCDGKENSNDSHRSNLSQHTSGAFKEGGLSDVSDSRSLSTGNQKFHYHPMGNVNEDVEPTYGQKQPAHGQSFELQRDPKGPNEESPQGNRFGEVANSSVPYSRPIDRYISPGQNMLELLHKVDQSRNHGAKVQLSSSECNASSQLFEAENFDGVGRLQLSQSSFSSSFELQLGPPSQRSRFLDHRLSYQNIQGTFNSLDSGNTAIEMGDKCQQMVASHSVQSLPSSEATQAKSKFSRSTILGHGNENSLYKTIGNFTSAFSSGIPYSRINVQNQQITSGQMLMNQHVGFFTGNASYKPYVGPIGTDAGGMAGDCQQRLPSATPETATSRGAAATTAATVAGRVFCVWAVARGLDSKGATVAARVSCVGGSSRVSKTGNAFFLLLFLFFFFVILSCKLSRYHTLTPAASRSFRQDSLASSGGMSLQNGLNDVQERVPTATVPTKGSEGILQQFAMPGLSGQGDSAELLHNVRTNVPTHQHDMGSQFQQASSHIPESSQLNILESSSIPSAQGQRLKESLGQLVALVNTDHPKMTNSLGKAPSMKNHLDESPASSGSTQKDIEAFGRSLKPNSLSHQNYSLQNQKQALKDAEIDSSNRVSKRMKGPDNIADVHEATPKAGQQNENNAMVGYFFGSITGAPTEDSRMLSFSKSADILQRNAYHWGNSNSSSDYMTSARADHPQVSPQMAPSWFNQYGTFKIGQMLHMYDVPKFTSFKPRESSFTLGKSSNGLGMHKSEEKRTNVPIDACQLGNNQQHCTPSSVANEHFSSPQSSQLNASGQHLVILRPKDMAEAEWNKAANCLAQKVEDDAELTEDGPPMLRSRRRLIFTTPSILSADATTGYEIVPYAVSRIELGDACSTVSSSSNLDVPCDGMDLPLTKGKSSERNIGRCNAKATEELTGRARKLEDDFLTLNKSASILDLRVECQDLEKFSIINRFARFIGCGQTENAETASTNVTASTRKPMPQKYVIAVPVPRSLPDRVQCLLL